MGQRNRATVALTTNNGTNTTTVVCFHLITDLPHFMVAFLQSHIQNLLHPLQPIVAFLDIWRRDVLAMLQQVDHEVTAIQNKLQLDRLRVPSPFTYYAPLASSIQGDGDFDNIIRDLTSTASVHSVNYEIVTGLNRSFSSIDIMLEWLQPDPHEQSVISQHAQIRKKILFQKEETISMGYLCESLQLRLQAVTQTVQPSESICPSRAINLVC
jgi:hypothetical protein